MKEGLQPQLRAQGTVFSQLPVTFSSGTPQLLRREGNLMGSSSASPFLAGHHLAYSTASCSSTSSEHLPQAFNLNGSFSRGSDVSTGVRHPLSVQMPRPTSDPEWQYHRTQEQLEPSQDPFRDPKMQSLDARASLKLDETWHFDQGSIPATTFGVAPDILPQTGNISSAAEKNSGSQAIDARLQATAPLAGNFLGLGTRPISPAIFSDTFDTFAHYPHGQPQAALISVTEPLWLPPMQRPSSNEENNGSRTMSMTGLGDDLGQTLSRAPPPAAIKGHSISGWQHSPIPGADLSSVFTTCYNYSPLPAQVRQPQPTASPYLPPRSFRPLGCSQVELQKPAQLSLGGLVKDEMLEPSSQISPLAPLSSNFSLYAAGPDRRAARHSYAPFSMDPPASSSMSTKIPTPSNLTQSSRSQSFMLGDESLSSFLEHSLTSPACLSPFNSAPPNFENNKNSSFDPYEAFSAQSAGVKRKRNCVAPRQLISCDFCRKRKIRCDGKVPCGNCSRRSKECNYQPYPRKRGKGRDTVDREVAPNVPP